MSLSLSIDVERGTKGCRVGDTKMAVRTYDVVLTHRRKGKEEKMDRTRNLSKAAHL